MVRSDVLVGLAIVFLAGPMGASTAQDIAPPCRVPTECLTRLQVIEGMTREACAVARNDELERLHAKGLADAAQILVVRANGQILRGMTTDN